MNLGQLVVMQKAGALKLTRNTEDTYLLAGNVIPANMIERLLTQIGWVAMSQDPIEIMRKTNSLIANIGSSIKNEAVLNESEITMSNTRVSETERTVDRFRIKCGELFEISIVTGVKGLKAKYAVFSKENQFTQPVATFSSKSELGGWINTLAGGNYEY